jgi:hypothetical protein
MNYSALAAFSLALSSVSARAGFVYLNDYDISFRVNGVNLAPGDYAAWWGLITPGNLATPDVFSAISGNDQYSNDGFFTSYGAGQNGYLGAILNLSDSNISLIPVGTQLGLALTTLSYSPSFGASFSFGASNLTNTVVLFDPGWMVPASTLEDSNYFLTSNTRAAYRDGQTVLIDYQYNGGFDVINLITIPEPSTAAILAGMSALGVSSIHRRRHRTG